MMSCKEVSRLLSESMERKLSFWQRMGLWLHLSMCKLCHGFAKNLRRLREAAMHYAQDIERDTADSDVALSNEARERIKRSLNS